MPKMPRFLTRITREQGVIGAGCLATGGGMLVGDLAGALAGAGTSLTVLGGFLILGAWSSR